MFRFTIKSQNKEYNYFGPKTLFRTCSEVTYFLEYCHAYLLFIILKRSGGSAFVVELFLKDLVFLLPNQIADRFKLSLNRIISASAFNKKIMMLFSPLF